MSLFLRRREYLRIKLSCSSVTGGGCTGYTPPTNKMQFKKPTDHKSLTAAATMKGFSQEQLNDWNGVREKNSTSKAESNTAPAKRSQVKQWNFSAQSVSANAEEPIDKFSSSHFSMMSTVFRLKDKKQPWQNNYGSSTRVEVIPVIRVVIKTSAVLLWSCSHFSTEAAGTKSNKDRIRQLRDKNRRPSRVEIGKRRQKRAQANRRREESKNATDWAS